MDAQTIVKLFIPFTIGVIMVAMGLGLTVADFKRVLAHPKAVLIGSINQLIVLPVVGFAVAFLFGLSAEFAVGLVLITACPGGPSSNLYSNLARGDTALSVTLTAVSGVATIVTIPLVTALALDVFMGADNDISMPVGDTMLRIVLVVGVPLAVGMLIRAKWTARALKAEPIVKGVAALLLGVLIVGAIMKRKEDVAANFAVLGVPVLLLSLSTIAIGAFSGLAFKLPKPQAITIGIEVGMQNAALAIGLALTSLGSEDIAFPAVIYGILAYFTCAVPLVIGRRMLPPPSTAEHAAAVSTGIRRPDG